MKFKLFGPALSNAVAHHHRLRKLIALPILASDALSSVAYGTEQILLVLLLAGTSALSLSIPIALAVCILLIILGISYYQTIEAYPNGGGAFTVAHENLGVFPALLAATALLIDYILTVAVSIAAGVFAITSAFPQFAEYKILICFIAILFITFINLRGVKESASFFAYPTYVFIFIIGILISFGIWHVLHHPIHPIILASEPNFSWHQNTPLKTLSLYLILSAFAQGCSALTGIECISNAVPVFKKPEIANARKTLIMMVTILAIMFLGITYLAHLADIVPTNQESVLSQLGHLVFHNGFLYFVLQIATATILFLAANTAFTGFPRLTSVLSEYKFLPVHFKSLGARLIFHNGIALLAIMSFVLILLFHASVNNLIPLYSVGVYLAFSLSQAGMVIFWLKKKWVSWKIKASINAIGCFFSLMALAVIISSKFLQGAWITVVLIITIPGILLIIRRHYHLVDKELSIPVEEAEAYLEQASHAQNKVIVPISRLHQASLAALNFARHASSNVTAVIVDVDPQRTAEVKSAWEKLGLDIELQILASPYRKIIEPLKNFILEQDSLNQKNNNNELCMLVMSDILPSKWWQYPLHNQRIFFLKIALMLNHHRHKTNKSRIFVNVSYQLNSETF